MKFFIYLLILHLVFAQTAHCFELNVEFFNKFSDKYLFEYINLALENNHDLKQANYRVEQYRYEIKMQFSKELPSLSVGSSYLGTHFPAGDINVIGKNAYVLPFSVTYEPDFLLKNADKTKSQKKIFLSKIANQKATYISLLSDVASAYFNILLVDYLVEKQRDIVQLKEKNLFYTEKKYEVGVIDLTELNDYRKELVDEKIIFDNLFKNQQTILYNFAVLIGISPDCINEIKRGKIEEIEYKGNIPQCVNSDVIYQRPDLEEIEYQLKSAKIDITVAKKEFFPSFNINGLYAMDSMGGGNFFSWDSAFAFILAGLTQDIFKGGFKIANLKIKKAKYYELFEKYKQADLNAIKEVNNALNLIKQDKKSEEFVNNQVELQTLNYLNSKKKFKYGVISSIEYYDTKSTLKRLEELWASSKTARLVDYVTLYKALGGEL